MKKLLKTMSVAAVVGAAVCGQGETVSFSPKSSDPDNIITNDVHYSKPIAEIARPTRCATGASTTASRSTCRRT